jgi:hypothetical protein
MSARGHLVYTKILALPAQPGDISSSRLERANLFSVTGQVFQLDCYRF